MRPAMDLWDGTRFHVNFLDFSELDYGAMMSAHRA